MLDNLRGGTAVSPLRFVHRDTERPFYRPPQSIDSHVNSLVRQSSLRSPLGEGFSDAIDRFHSVGASVVALVASYRPSTIIFGIFAVVIDSFDRVSRSRTRTHIRHERGKRLPPWIEGDASSAISHKIRAVFVRASVLHASPNSIFGLMSVTQSSEAASATQGETICKGVLSNRAFSSAVAPTSPEHIAPPATFRRQNDPTSESQADQVFHDLYSLMRTSNA